MSYPKMCFKYGLNLHKNGYIDQVEDNAIHSSLAKI